MLVLISILALVVLGSPFGEAEAKAVDDEAGLAVEMSVEVAGAYEAVLVRPFSSFEELAPTALVNRGDGTWGGFVIFPTAEDWSVAFDAIASDGETARSDTVSLTDMGVDPVVVEAPPAGPVPSTPIDAGRIWLIVGVVLAIAALGALTWWTFGSGGSGTEPDPLDPPAT